MKKKNLKSLKISKVLISNFTESTVKGGGESRISCQPYTCYGNTCPINCPYGDVK
jgi:hypothetical protein